MGVKASRPVRGLHEHVQSDGRVVYIIEREVGGKRYHVSTHAHDLRAALEQVKLFEEDPEGYKERHGRRPGRPQPVCITDELCAEFQRWQLETKGNGPKHVGQYMTYLGDWREDLGAVDLRGLSLRDTIKPALEKRKTCRSYRIAALKCFYGWLREEKHLLVHAEDPTLDLPIPQARPEKWKRRKAVPFVDVQAAARELAGAYRDMLVLAAATGWHTTELERFIRSAESQLAPGRGKTLAVLVTKHKNREETRTPVADPQVLEAAQRLRERGRVPKRPNEKLAEACLAAGVPVFTFGVMRHSVATWAVDRGSPTSRVSEFLGHKDSRTTQRFYADVASPTVKVNLPRLKLVR